MRAILRRAAPAPDRVEVGELVVDRAARRASVAGVAVPLAAREFQLLAKLAVDPTRVFTKERLLREVWGYRASIESRTVDAHASRLRRKLAAVGGERGYVVNVWGVGYKLVESAPS